MTIQAFISHATCVVETVKLIEPF